MRKHSVKIYFPRKQIWGIATDYMAGVLIVTLQKRNGYSDETYVMPSEIVPHGFGLWRKVEK